MKPEEQKILNDSLSKLFKIEPETLASLYNEAGDLTDFSPVMDLDAKRIQKYKAENDSQYKRGIKEGTSKIEAAIKEKYEVESELIGVDLIDHLIIKKVDEAKTSSTKDITKHPDYIRLQLESEKKLKERDKEWTGKLEAREKEYGRAKLFEKVREKALINLESRKPILPSDPRKAQTWRETYLNELKNSNYQESDDGSIIVLDKDGGILKNAHGNTISFDEYERDIADKYFEYPKAEERSSPGLKVEPGNNKPGFTPPKNEDERLERLRDPKITTQQRKELTEFVIK